MMIFFKQIFNKPSKLDFDVQLAVGYIVTIHLKDCTFQFVAELPGLVHTWDYFFKFYIIN